MRCISQLGGEILFMAIVIALFWCMDKRKGYYLMTVGFFGIVANQFLKLVFRVSRPWIRDPEFTIVEGARAGATGYSFPSGHTQNAAAVLGCPARMARKKGLKITLWVLYALVGISRMYLGVHTPYDVGVGVVMGLVLVFGSVFLSLCVWGVGLGSLVGVGRFGGLGLVVVLWVLWVLCGGCLGQRGDECRIS